jgi:hypothetical protein
MNGQWMGNYIGSTTGTIIVEIDELAYQYRGVAYLLESDARVPNAAAFFATQNKDKVFSIRSESIHAINQAGLLIEWEDIKASYPTIRQFSRYVDIKGSLNGDELELSWTSDTGVAGRCILPRSKADKPSDLPFSEMTWESFKEQVAKDESKRYLFRGQSGPWRLRTSFHRRGRANVLRFLQEDIQVLRRHLSARTKHVFNLLNSDENGAFFNLVQHHGYPTPLLDWSYSPYVAAFFAYRGISNEDMAARATDKVRIFVFDQTQWRADQVPVLMAAPAWRHVTIGEFLAIENERMIPQQAASMITNIDDIETFIRTKELGAKKYLWAIDLLVGERRTIVRELAYMGITAGSLFPGLDGACEELTERNF